MKVKALVSFAGSISMARDEVREIKDKETLDDLLNAGYVEKVKNAKQVETDED